MKLRTLDDRMFPLAPETREEWEREREEILATLRFASSADLLTHDAPLNARVFDPVEYDGFTVEKVYFESLPGLYVTGSLYRPSDVTKKYPAVLNPHGHWPHGRLETEPLARIPRRCANLALRGMVAFSYDMVGYNDSTQLPYGFFDPEHEKWNFGCFAVQLQNSRRAIDFVQSLPYVDGERIGCTGCSGGGTQTYFLAALDERVKAAAPVNMASALMQGGCMCENAAFLRRKYCNVDYVMTIAPRPLFLSASDGDWTCESEQVEFPAVERVYRLYGAPENFEHFYQHAPHCYDLPIRERVYRFFCKHFGLDDPFPGEVEVEIDPETLRVGPLPRTKGFIQGVGPLFELAKRLIGRNLAALSPEARAELRARVFALDETFPLDVPYTVKTRHEYEVKLGRCPEDADPCGATCPHCYNLADDAMRVNGLYRLFREYPGAVFTASGKTAALCRIAASLGAKADLRLSEEGGEVFIPGGALIGQTAVAGQKGGSAV